MIYNSKHYGMLRVKEDKIQEYAKTKYVEHKKAKSEIYKKAVYEVWHNNFYTNLTNEEYENSIINQFTSMYSSILSKRNRLDIIKGPISETYYHENIIPFWFILKNEVKAFKLYEFHKKINHKDYLSAKEKILTKENENLTEKEIDEKIKKEYISDYVLRTYNCNHYDKKTNNIKKIIDQIKNKPKKEKLIKLKREDQELTIKDVAFELSIPEEEYIQIENEIKTPNQNILESLSVIYDCSIDELVENRPDYKKIKNYQKLEENFLALTIEEQNKIIDDCEYFANKHLKKNQTQRRV